MYTIDDLLLLMSRLRDPDSGCPWDLKQNFKTIVPSTLEEVYELVDAIEQGDDAHIAEELGDVLFQVVFYAQLGHEQDLFDWPQVVNTLTTKLIRRHPHVFPDGTLESNTESSLVDEAAIKASWENIKAQERQEKSQAQALADIPMALPALSRAQKIQKRASNFGFDWEHLDDVFDQLQAEIEELRGAIALRQQDAIEDELGDVLFSAVNLSRHLKVDAEAGLRRSNHKFESRFNAMEASLQAQGVALEDASFAQMEAIWQANKKQA